MTFQEVVTQAAIQQPQYNHAIIALWALGAIVVAQAIVLWIMFKARGGWNYLATIPITNLRSLVAVGLFAITVVGTGLVGYFAGVWPPEYIYDSTLIAETTWAGIEVAAVWLKRRTTNPEIASNQNLQSGVATQTATLPIPGKPAPKPPAEVEVAGDSTPLDMRPVPPRPLLTNDDAGII